MEKTEECNAAIKEWQEITDWLKTAKKREAQLRKIIVNQFVPDEQAEGTHRIEHNDLLLTIGRKLNRKLDKTLIDNVFARLPEGSRELLIGFEPKLQLANYRKIDQSTKDIVNEAVITTSGAATLVITTPTEE